MSKSPPTGSSPEDPRLQRTYMRESLEKEQGPHPRMSMSQIQMRIGQRFISVWWLVPALLGLLGAFVLACKLVLSTGLASGFVRAHPCEQNTPTFPPGVSAWDIATHAANFFFLVMIIRAGWQILADHPRLYRKVHCTPDSEWLRFRGPIPKDRVWTSKDDAIMLTPLAGMPGGRHTIGLARHWHFIFDILFVLNGIVFLVLTFTTQHYLELVPTQLSILPAAGSCAIQYGALHLPHEMGGYFRFDALQQLSYFAVVFIAAPLAILTGIAMSPAFDNRFKWYARIFGNRQIARSLHFLVMVIFVAFYAVHMTLVASTGFARNLDVITLGSNQNNLNGVALFFLAIIITVAFNVWAVKVTWTHTRVLQRISNLTVGKVMSLLFGHLRPRAEYGESDISPYFWPNGLVPTDAEWLALRDQDWRTYRLKVSGLVEHPLELSLSDLRELGQESHITMHNCIQGWSAIGQWSGLPMLKLIELAHPHPEAKWAMFYSFGEGGEGGQYYDSHAMSDLTHPQSLLAYEMNGEPLPVLHGAPLRLRVENQLGFKQVKWIKEIEFVADFRNRGEGQGGYNEDHEFYGYRDEI